jgi:hypothetical protein
VLTIFTIPRAFTGVVGIVQRNAIESWRRLAPDVELILFGDDAGVAEAARALGARHEPRITRNEFGTPLLDGVFARTEATARHHLLCYVNADIILLPEFAAAVRSIRARRFLMVGDRWDMDIESAVDFSNPEWAADLRERAHRMGDRQPPWGSDYFVFPRGTIGPVPPFAVGRPRWDNWMIYNARRRGLPMFDASNAVTAIHPNHDYAHWPKAADGSTPEERLNEVAFGSRHFYTLAAATHLVTPSGPRPALTYAHLNCRIKHLVRYLLPVSRGGHGAWTARRRAAGATTPPLER